jgi:hypothetical protein
MIHFRVFLGYNSYLGGSLIFMGKRIFLMFSLNLQQTACVCFALFLHDTVKMFAPQTMVTSNFEVPAADTVKGQATHSCNHENR